MSKVPAYSITTEAIAKEAERVGGDWHQIDVSKVLCLDQLELRPVGPDDVRMRILAVSCEHNIDHAATADTINIADARGGKIYPGNSATGEVVEVGERVTKFKPGDIVITHCNGEPDRFGFPQKIWAYDMEDSTGWYAKEAVVGAWQLLHAPLQCGLNLWEIAALPLRAPTAWHLWRRAIGIYRVKVTREQQATLNVLGFGGGVSELFLMNAVAEGHRGFFCSGSPERRAALEKQGIVGIDQKAFNRFASRDDLNGFRREVKSLTDGEGMHLVCDMLRGPVFPAGFAVSARQGVNVSAGWQLSQKIDYNSTLASVKQITLDHTHYETPPGCEAATELYGSVYKPTIHHEVYSWEDLPRAHSEMHHNTQTGIPIARVADDLPESVRDLVLRSAALRRLLLGFAATLGGLLLAAVGLGVGLYAPLFDGQAALEWTRSVERGEPTPRRAILVSIDGLAPRVLAAAATPTLDRLARQGASAVLAETVMPSITMSAHTSMLTGVGPDVHGVRFNRYQPWSRIRTPGLFDVCHERALLCGLFAGKKKFFHFVRDEPGAARYVYGADADAVLAAASDWIREADPDFVMIHLAEVDLAGHEHGWGSEPQRAALAELDRRLGDFVASAVAASSRPLVLLVSADHGGHDTRHGSDAPEDIEIPWLLWGDGVPPGLRFARAHVLDIEPTLLDVLGVPGPAPLPGRSRYPSDGRATAH